MNRPLYVSTGALVGRVNGYDLRGGLDIIADLYDQGICRGLELMMLTAYYSRADEVLSLVRGCGVPTPVIHCEKDVGTLLSDAGTLYAAGKSGEADGKRDEALRLFRLNCIFGGALSIPRMVLHLWGGYASDHHVDYNISELPELSRIASEHGIRLLIENVPSSRYDPLSNWRRLLPSLEDGGLIFDTRFGQLHNQIRETLTDPEIAPRIEHVHISDFGGGYRDFSALRPILHPGEGTVDFPQAASLLDAMDYRGGITLESPVMGESGRDTDKLERTLRYLADLL